MIRLFIGLKIPETVRGEVARLCSGIEGARWVRPENLHVTLRFIGEVGEELGPDIDAALGAVSAPAFEVAFRGIDCFASRRRARSIWTAVAEPAPVTRLHAKIETALGRIGFGAEGRKFIPHLTLARFNNTRTEMLRPYLEAGGGFESSPFEVADFTLYRSHLGSGGAQYEALADYPLDSGGSGR